MSVKRFLLIALSVLILLPAVSCSTKKHTCSIDADCASGQYCGDKQECIPMKASDFSIAFVDVTSPFDVYGEDREKDSLIDLTVRVTHGNDPVTDGTVVGIKRWSKTIGTEADSLSAQSVNGLVHFSDLPVKYPYDRVTAFYKQNPTISTELSLQYHEVAYDMYFVAENGDKKPLDGVTLSLVDDLDPDTPGIQLHLVADIRGFKSGSEFTLTLPETDAKPIATKTYNPPPENRIDYGTLTFPQQETIKMVSSTADGFSKETVFHIAGAHLCTFSVDLKDHQILGKKDDENGDSTYLDRTVTLSHFVNCPKSAGISIELWKGDRRYQTAVDQLDSDSVSIRLPLEPSATVDDGTTIHINILDSLSTVVGARVIKDVIADMIAPTFTAILPQNGQVFTMKDDTDASKPGIQLSFSGTAADNISSLLSTIVSINDTVVSGPSDLSTGTMTFPQSFNTSLHGATVSFTLMDEGGNETVVTIPFSVVLESRIFFSKVCSKTDDTILDNMWLNRSDDTDGATAGLQCAVEVTVDDSVDADQVILHVGGTDMPAQPIGTDHKATFALSSADSNDGILLKAETSGGGGDVVSAELTVKIDTIDPVVSLSNNLSLPDNGDTDQTGIEFTQSCAGEVSCEFSGHRDDESWSAWSADDTASFSNLDSGDHTFHARARDAAGNEGIETVFHWTIRSPEPQTTITTHPDAVTNIDYAQFSFVSDKTPATFECRLYKDGVQVVPATGWDNCSIGTKGYFSLGDGSYEFRVRATAGGIVESTPATFSWKITQDLPVTTITSVIPADNVVSSDTITFTYKSSIAGSSFQCRLLKNGTVSEDWTNCDSGTKTYSSLTDAEYLFEVKAITGYGAEEMTPARHGWTIDTSKPLVTVTTKPPAVTGFPSARFVFTCEGETAPCNFECSLDGATATVCTSPYTTPDLAEGDHNLVITAIDEADNRSVVVTDQSDPHVNSINWTYRISTALEVRITSQPQSITKSTDASFAFEATRAGSTFTCKLDSGTDAPCTSPFVYHSVADGTHTFTVTAHEGSDTASASYSWTVDNAAPVITLTSHPDNPTVETGASFSFTANESVSGFECKADGESWHSCPSPTVYASGTFGTADTETTHTFDVRATDTAGNEGTLHFEWVVDLRKPTISWQTPAPHPDGRILVGPSNDVYLGDDTIYAIDAKVRVEGAKVGSQIKVIGFHTPPGYTPVYVTTSAAKVYTLRIGLEQGNYVLNNIKIEVESLTGYKTTIAKAVIVTIDKPSITWNSPYNGKFFQSDEPTGKFRFNIWNSEPGITVELVRDDTDTVIGTAETTGSHDSWEIVDIQATLPDSCTPYHFYGRFRDPVSGKMMYTNSTDVKESRTIRSVGFDIHPPTIDSVTIAGLSDTDRYLNRSDNLNNDPDGVMQTDITVHISDAQTPGDTKRKVWLFTNVGSGNTELATQNNVGQTALFSKESLSDNRHQMMVKVQDCGGNIDFTVLPLFTVDTKPPVLTLTAPIGSYSNKLLVVADDPTLGTISASGDFTGVTMSVKSNEELLEDATVYHKIYTYDGTLTNGPDGDEISDSAITYGTKSLLVNLPDLSNNKHDFVVTAHDQAGNETVLGGDPNEFFLVDTVIPLGEITNLSDGEEINDFELTVSVDFSSINRPADYTLTATPIVSQGGGIDTSRIAVSTTGTIDHDQTLSVPLKTGGGWWRLTVAVRAETSNHSESVPIDVHLNSTVPSLTLKKSYDYAQGAGPVLLGFTSSAPAWLHSKDISCTGDNCTTDLEVWTNAPVGTAVNFSVDGGSTTTVQTIDGGGGASVALFNGITFDASQEYSTLAITINSATPRSDTRYLAIDKTNPTMTIMNPSCAGGVSPCNIKPLTDNPGTPEIELAEIGFGVEDSAVSGDTLHFASNRQIIFKIEGATEGKVKFEADSHLHNTSTSIVYDTVHDRYVADFNALTIKDTNPDGQTDIPLKVTVYESPSGASTTYLLKIHLELVTPAAINIAGHIDTNASRGSARVLWTAIQGNDSHFGGKPGAMHRYDVKYEDYGMGVCTIESNFESAISPLETIAGPIPEPQVGEMDYTFYYTRSDNGKGESDPAFREADIHRNGDHYCFAVRAVDAVYAEDGTVLRYNKGIVLPADVGAIEMAQTTLTTSGTGYHTYKIKNLGDLNGDEINDLIVGEGQSDSVYIIISRIGMPPTVQKLTTPNDALEGQFGYYVAPGGDINGDGVVDALVVSNTTNTVHIFYGDNNGTPENKSDDFIHTDRDEKITFSDQINDIAIVGDITGSGCDSFAVGFSAYDTKKGKVSLFGCGSSGDGDLLTEDAALLGTTQDQQFGNNIIPAGDVNNDGLADFIVAERGIPAPTHMKLFFGSLNILNADQTVAITPATGTGVTEFSVNQYLAGYRVMTGDINGDDFADAILLENQNIKFAFGGPSGYSIPATWEEGSTLFSFSDIMNTVIGGETQTALFTSGFLADLDEDGFDDLIIGGAKATYLYRGTDTLFYPDPIVYFEEDIEYAAVTAAIMSHYGIVICDSQKDLGGCDFYAK